MMSSTEAAPPQIIVLGDVAVDRAVEVDALPNRGALALARSCERFAGGSAANVAVGLARLGHRVDFLGQIGDDENGRFLLNAFEREGVDTRGLVTLPGYETPACLVVLEDGGDHFIIVLPRDHDVHRLHDPDLSRLTEAAAIHIGPSHTDVARRAAAQAREHGALVFYAPGGLARALGRAALQPVLKLVDGLFVSGSEAFALTDRPTPEEAARALLAAGPAVVVETTGVEGALVATDDALYRVPVVPVSDARDTTGAGDAFAAGFIAAYLRGFDWEVAGHIGSAVAALKIRHLGARTGLPTWDEALSAVDSGLWDRKNR